MINCKPGLYDIPWTLKQQKYIDKENRRLLMIQDWKLQMPSTLNFLSAFEDHAQFSSDSCLTGT
jgi:hypothetical protein